MDYMRQVGMFNPAQHSNVKVTIAGLGNIGSHTALALARMGLSHFTLYDFDTVEEHNLSSQAYLQTDVGRSKVAAITDQIRALNPTATVVGHIAPFTGIEQVGDILVSAVDSLAVRRMIAEGVPAGTYVIDGRMGGGQIEVHSQPIDQWLATIPAEADTDACGARYISYTSYIIAGLIANQVKRKLQGEKLATRILMHVDTTELLVTREIV